MTNGEHYKTCEDRIEAHDTYCENRVGDCYGECDKCAFAWLAMEYKPKPMLCPFCGCEVIELRIGSHTNGVYVVCSKCGCRTDELKNETDAIESWNRRVK